MAPKKKTDDVKKIPLGRPGNNLKLGIVGVPNSGKTTAWNALAKLQSETSAVPFHTTDAKAASVNVPDERILDLFERYKPKSEVPAQIAVYDTAGIVNGSTKGEGMGMQFVSNIIAVDGLFHVLRAFTDPDVVHLEDTVDPVRDVATVTAELLAKDLEFCTERLESEKKHYGRAKSKDLEAQIALLEKIKGILEDGKPVRNTLWTPNEVALLNPYNFLTAKTVTYLVNLNEKDFIGLTSKWGAPIRKWQMENDPDAKVIIFCATLEEQIAPMSEADRTAALKELGAKASMRDHIIKTGYNSLDLCHFFTAGDDEVRAWTIRRGYKAPQAAGVIHSDFERGFISADVFTYEDFKVEGSEAALKAAGKLMQKGKDYEVQDGDVCHFKFNLGGGKKK